MGTSTKNGGIIRDLAQRANKRRGDLLRMSREIMLQNLFYRSADALGLELPALYPVGGAANYGLLYLVMRVVSENKVIRVLDIGAGQTSLLLNALAQKFPIEPVTLESDAAWASHIGSKVQHQVVHSPLTEREIDGRWGLCYSELSAFDGKFDFIVVDGPMGTDRFSRWTALEILSKFQATEFVTIFDDAERVGERDTIDQFMRANSERQLEGHYFSPALKQQFVAYTPAFSHIRYYEWL